MTAEQSLDSFKFKEQGVNTEDTLRYVPFEVDHWATKCVRFADEFQTSRSFDDAQSNISELTDSLEQYLKLHDQDGALRTDILLHCVLSNIIEGLEANEHIFTDQVPSVSKILTQSLLTSGQLGRYGFQSFKQSVKAIKFLKQYYRKREMVPEKLPVILWQSMKKVSMNETTMYPTLFPGEFHFHMESCPDSEDCKVIPLMIGDKNTPVYLKYCTFTNDIIEAFKTLPSQDLDFGCDHVEPKFELKPHVPTSVTDSSKISDISLQNIVVCNIDLNLSCRNHFSILQKQPQYSKSLDLLQQNHGGSVILRFKSRFLNAQDSKGIFILGTKQYWEKHIQILLVDDKPQNDDGGWLVADLHSHKIQAVQAIEHLKWDLKFGSSCPSGCWTYPKVHFVEKLTILPLLEDCTIYFEPHTCLNDKPTCSDCKLVENHSNLSVDQVFASGSVQINVKLDLKPYDLFDDLEKTIINSGHFALFKFSLSLPLGLRNFVIELQKESKLRKRCEQGLFNQRDFDTIVKLWDQHKDYYYAVWYIS